MIQIEIPITAVPKPKTHAVDPANWKDDGRNPSNIPSIHKQNTPKSHRKVRVKKMPDVQPALEQLFEKEGTGLPIEPPPVDVPVAEVMMKQVMQELDNKSGKRLSEMI